MSPRESNSDRMTCQLQGRTAVGQATDAARVFGEVQWLAEDELARLCIIIEELVANLYEHGGLTEIDKVELSLGSEPGGIRVTIVDSGKPFDPRSAPTKGRRPQRGGGVGIDIVRSWAQFVAYDVTAAGNRLQLLLPLRLHG
jgi:anti-sigma regulatory factor (Ser/Thr protein kinase)